MGHLFNFHLLLPPPSPPPPPPPLSDVKVKTFRSAVDRTSEASSSSLERESPLQGSLSPDLFPVFFPPVLFPFPKKPIFSLAVYENHFFPRLPTYLHCTYYLYGSCVCTANHNFISPFLLFCLLSFMSTDSFPLAQPSLFFL